MGWQDILGFISPAFDAATGGQGGGVAGASLALGGMGGGGNSSLMNMAKQGQQSTSLLQRLGLGGTPGIAPDTQPRNSGQGDPYGALARWGSGVSKASGYSRMPMSMGQVMAAGNDAMQQGQNTDIDNQLKQAQAQAYGAKGPDFDAQAQQALIKQKMGIPLSPQEKASMEAWDTFNQSKLVSDPFGNTHPAARSIMPPDMGATPTGGQAPDMQKMRGYHEYLKQKAGQQ